VLRAISCFEHGIVPREQPNFQNYEPLEGAKYLQARFSVDPAAGWRLSADTFMTGIIQRFSSTPLKISFSEGHYAVTPSAVPGAAQAVSLLNYVYETYSTLIDNIHEMGQVWIDKNADGSYEFLTEEGIYDDFKARKERIDDLINRLNSAFRSAGKPNKVALDSEYVEGLLYMQFPEIFFCTERFTINENLPRSLNSDHLKQPLQNNALTEAFVSLIGTQTLWNLLHASGRKRIESYTQAAQNEVDALCAKINADASLDTAGAEFLQIYIDRAQNVRIIVEVDGKESYYEHLSDNTKFLVAYHILQEDREHKNSLPGVLLFDEPNKGFHPSAEGKMLRFLSVLTEKDNQVLVTTHSQHLIDLDRLPSIRIMTRAEDGTLRVDNRLHGASGASQNALALQPVTDAIGLQYANQIVTQAKVIVVEGYTDMLYLRLFSRLLGYDQPNVAPVTGDPKIPTFLSFLISQGISFKVAIDSLDVKDRIVRAFPIPEQSFFVVEERLTGRTNETVGIEDLFSREDFTMLLQRAGHSANEKHLSNVSNSGYAKIPGIKVLIAREAYESTDLTREHFSKETVEHFEELLRFCEDDSWFKA
jgi:hypothetical protein